MEEPLSVERVREAALRLEGVAHRTPLDFSETFSAHTGSLVYLKLENLQKTGSFKIRGAFNKMCRLGEEEKARGVVTASAGNHAQGVAYAAARAGIEATVVMPESAPMAKVEATRGYGARVVLAGRGYDEAHEEALRLCEETGATYIHGFDDADIVAGQATLGLEILEQLPDVEVIVVPVGGGGLASGVAFIVKSLRPEVKVFGVQASGAASTYRSFQAGTRVELPRVETFADGIAVRRPGRLTFDLMRRYLDGVVAVDDEEIARAVLLLLERSKIVVEGAGAVGLAALLEGRLAFSERRVAVVLSGGNIDMNVISNIIERGLVRSGRRVRLRTFIPDRPGSLQALLEVVAGARANIIGVFHERSGPRVPIGQAEVELVLETRGPEHVLALEDALKNKGYGDKNGQEFFV